MAFKERQPNPPTASLVHPSLSPGSLAKSAMQKQGCARYPWRSLGRWLQRGFARHDERENLYSVPSVSSQVHAGALFAVISFQHCTAHVRSPLFAVKRPVLQTTGHHVATRRSPRGRRSPRPAASLARTWQHEYLSAF